MGRAPCCEKVGLRRGRWSAEEDKILSDYIEANGEGSWRSLPKKAGLLRCGKSCRLRWINYLRCDVKRGNISKEEEDTIIKLHASIGNKWSLIAGHLGGGRTDNEIKNYWNSHLNPLRSCNTTKRSSSRMMTPQSSLSNNEEKDKELLEEGLLQNGLTTSDSNKETDVDDDDDDTSKLDNKSEWEWDFEVLGGLEEENSMFSSWPWDDDPLVTHEHHHSDENKKQIIAWLLS